MQRYLRRPDLEREAEGKMTVSDAPLPSTAGELD